MTLHDVAFLLVALLTGGSAVMMVLSKNLVHAALSLAVTLTGIAGTFLVLAADFLALVQLVVYVGAVAVLFLFGLMLTRAPIGREALDNQDRGTALGVAAVLFLVLGGIVVAAFGGEGSSAVTGPRVADIGTVTFSQWALPFEVLSMLLLAALVGAIAIARREAGESGAEAEPTRIELGDEPAAERDPAGAIEAGEDRAELTSGGEQ